MKCYYKYQNSTVSKKNDFYHSIKWTKAIAIFFFISFGELIPLKTKKPNPNGQGTYNYKKCHFNLSFFINYTIKKVKR
ncbi:hypothetical protein CE91St25_15230 [Campylobacter ureolyticus]|nr:hypothetical protein CE91St25_15230 [Campylobacter ureolyticus]